MPKSNDKLVTVLALIVGYTAHAVLGSRGYRHFYAMSQELAKKLEA